MKALRESRCVGSQRAPFQPVWLLGAGRMVDVEALQGAASGTMAASVSQNPEVAGGSIVAKKGLVATA